VVRDGVFNLDKGFRMIEEVLDRGEYSLLLMKKVDGKEVKFSRRIDFRILAVELNIAGVPAKEKEEPGAFIPLNGENVNKSKTTFGIPEKYDFEVNPLPKASLLVQAKFLVGEEGAPPKGITGFRLRVENRGRARIRVWDTPTKQNEVKLPKDWTLKELPSEIWIEGVREGAAEREVLLTFEMLRGTQVLCSDATAITVTPILRELLIATTGKNVAPDLEFDQDLKGLVLDSNAKDPKHTAMTLDAVADARNLNGKLKFVQFTRNVNNLAGGFGADLGGGDKRKWDWGLNKAGKWLLDSQKGAPPFFISGEEPGKTKLPTTKRVLAEDSPELPVGENIKKTDPILPAAGKSTEVDVTFEFATFAVWEFPDGTVYFLGAADWNIRYAGTLMPNPKNKLGFDYIPAPADPKTKLDKNKNTGNNGKFIRDNDSHLNPNKPLFISLNEPLAGDAAPNWRK
jgi:hypothetical protein